MVKVQVRGVTLLARGRHGLLLLCRGRRDLLAGRVLLVVEAPFEEVAARARGGMALYNKHHRVVVAGPTAGAPRLCRRARL